MPWVRFRGDCTNGTSITNARARKQKTYLLDDAYVPRSDDLDPLDEQICCAGKSNYRLQEKDYHSRTFLHLSKGPTFSWSLR